MGEHASRWYGTRSGPQNSPSDNFPPRILFVYGMSDRTPTRTLGNFLGFLIFGVIAAVLIFYGASIFLGSHWQVSPHPAVGITHSTPVGGAVEDGVYRSAPDDKDGKPTTWRI